MTNTSLIHKTFNIGLSPLSSRQEHGGLQAGMVQEELRVLHLDPKAEDETFLQAAKRVSGPF